MESSGVQWSPYGLWGGQKSIESMASRCHGVPTECDVMCCRHVRANGYVRCPKRAEYADRERRKCINEMERGSGSET